MKNTFTILLIIFICAGLSAQEWKREADIAGPVRHHPITFAIQDTGYVLTGFSDGNRLLNDFYKYEPKSNTWTKLPDFPGPARSFGYGVVNDGKAYVGFGLSATNQRLNDLWEYDPQTGNWKQLANCSCSGRRHPAMVSTINGKVFVGMGDDASPAFNLNDWYEYNIRTNSWYRHHNLPGNSRHHPYFFGIGTDAYVGFGHGSVRLTGKVQSSTPVYRDFYKFNSMDSSWTRLSDFPDEGRVAGAQFDDGTYGYVISGEDETHNNFATGQLYKYFPSTDSWKRMGDHPGDSRWATGTFVTNNKVYLIAGEDSRSVKLKDMWSIGLSDIDTTDKKVEPVTIDEKQTSNSTVPLRVYPNPAQTSINIELPSASKVQMSILQVNGQLLLSRSSEQKIITVDLAGIRKGVYILRVQGENVFHNQVFIKQ